jgi:large subunit ribosomal protein L6
MSRVGKLPIKLSDKIKVELSGKKLQLSNSKLTIDYSVRPNVEVNIIDSEIKLSPRNGDKNFSVDVGMDRSNINNIVSGLVEPFEIKLEVNGVGYKAAVSQSSIVLSLGYSHDIFYSLPKFVTATFEKPNIITLTSHDKILVGQVAAEIIAFRKPEPYKGKGVNILGRKIIRKEGKKK